MTKIILKGIIVILGVQSLMANLQKQNIIEGSVKINYAAIQQKAVAVLQSEEVSTLVRKMADSQTVGYLMSPREKASQYNEPFEDRNRGVQCLNHVVREGETLSELAQVYGVAWQVIKKANRIYDERRLQIGQSLIIPTRMI